MTNVTKVVCTPCPAPSRVGGDKNRAAYLLFSIDNGANVILAKKSGSLQIRSRIYLSVAFFAVSSNCYGPGA